MKNESGFTATGDKVLIRPLEFETKTSGGLIVVDQTKDREELASQMGWLVAESPQARAGKDYKGELDGIELGDMVLFPRYQHAEFKIDGQRYWYLRVSSILGKATRLPDSVFRGAESSVSVFGVGGASKAA